jgi:PAS domain S-box-containing protein
MNVESFQNMKAKTKEQLQKELVEMRQTLATMQASETGRKQTEEALRASEERYRSLFENMLDGYAYCQILFEHDQPQDFIYLAVNPTFEKLTGLKNVVGQKVTQVIPGIQTSNPELFEIYGRVALTGKPEKFETYLPSLGIWFSIVVFSPARGYFVSVFDNITTRKQAEEALSESEARFHQMFERHHAIMLLIEPQTGLILDANQASVNFYGYTKSQLCAMSINDINMLPPEQVAIERQKAFTEVRNYFVFPHKLASGEERIVEVHSSPIDFREKQVLFSIIHDITDRKRAEESLRAEEERFRLAAESLSDVVYEWDLGNRVQWFGNIDELLGYAPGEFPCTLEAWVDILHPEDRERVWTAVERHLRGEAAYDIEYRVRHKDGTWRHWLARGTVPRDASGKPSRWIGAITDTTERKWAEEALQESEEKYRNMIANLSEGVYNVTLDGILVDHNIAFNRILGFDPEENLVGIRLPDFWQNPEDRQVYLEEFRQHGSIRNYLVAAKKRDREKIFVEVSSRLVNDKQGQPARIEGTVVDITARKRMEEALKESEAKYRAFFENAQVGLYCSKLDGSAFLEMNNKFAELFGYSREELLGTPGRIRWAHPAERDKMVKLLRDQGGVLVNYEIQVLAKNGDVKDILASIELHSDKGTLDGTMVDITERKQAEEALRISENKYRKLHESMRDGFVYVDMQGRIRECSESYQTMLGYPAEELAQLTYVDLTPEKWHVYEQKIVAEQILPKGFSAVYEKEYRKKDGTIFPVELRTFLIQNDAGENEGMWALVRDITDRKQAEEKIQTSEAFLNRMIEQSPSAMWISDDHGNLMRLNQACCDLLNITADEVVGRYNIFQDNIVQEQGFLPQVKAVFERGETARFEIRYDSSQIEGLKLQRTVAVILDVTIFPIKDTNGRITHAVIQHNNITERKRAEESLRESEENFRTIAENANDGILIAVDKGVHAYVNKRAAEITGYSESELLTTSIKDLAHPDEFKKIMERYRKRLAGEAVPPQYETMIINKDGKSVPIELTSAKTVWQRQPADLVILRDITERKRVEAAIRRSEAELKRLNLELEQKNKELEQLVYVTSHDLRSPLVNVQGFSQELRHAVQDLTALLQSPEVPEHLRQKAAALVEKDIQEDLHYILASIAKMDVLLSGLLKLSRLGRVVLTITTLDLNTLLANILTTFAFHIQAAGVTVEVAELPSCTGDATQIYQVFSNLIDNALKYRDPHRPGVIKIWGDPEGDHIIYCVEDNGIGIAPEHQLQIFEIFHRLNPKHTPGEGLGLTIARRILERQGGKIWVESEPGKGSKFYVSLP